ncbi:MAG: TlyA family RNA methyltransferase [Dehalococcoidia bacterium]|nr:TlyA family RNA methyltransferase [Dehalococcoidia bacterium]
MTKERVDLALVRRGLVESREKARAMILAGQVRAADRVLDKPGTLVSLDIPLRLLEQPPYVSRGGVKLAHALDAFSLDVGGKVVLDVGASTGGFTDCLLQRGARKVYAVDVGYGQIALRLRQDPRVVVMERTNIRYLSLLPENPDLATIDTSFISLEKVIPPVLARLGPESFVLALVKPQFEAGRGLVGKGGVIRDPAVHRAVLERLCLWAGVQGLSVKGITASPILGPAGNREFFLYLDRSGPGIDCLVALEGLAPTKGQEI